MSTATALSPDEVLALPAMPTAKQAFLAMNISRDTGYALIAAGEFPIEVLRLGRAMRVRRGDLLAFLGLPESNDDKA
ncbi:helix-turn-helix domain-containing protein [Streptomyces longispororuber]|uniref:helix-turn-helix domain-containing protein n=1 Tax=Streptomyces longispororuber TaxID=68230 RepID=UPI0037023EED